MNILRKLVFKNFPIQSDHFPRDKLTTNSAKIKQTLTIQSFRHTIQPKSGSEPSESDGTSDRSNSSVASTVIVYENDTDNNEMTVAKIQAAIMFASKRTVGRILEITLRTAVSNYWLSINKTNRETIGE